MKENINELNVVLNNEKDNWKTKDTVFAIITFIASVFFVSLSLFGGFNLGFTISFVLLFILVNLYISKNNKKYTPFSLFCGISAVLLSGTFTFYNHAFINFLLFCGCFILLWIFTAVSFVGNDHIIKRTIHTAFITPFKNIPAPFKAYSNHCNKDNRKGPNLQIIIGLAISVPILAIVLPLLVSSDAAFEGLMTRIFSDVFETIVKIILGSMLAMYIFSKLFAVDKKLDKDCGINPTDNKVFPHIVAVTILSVLSIFYTVYLFSQLAYFFSAFSGILPEGYTFSVAEYARRGFFELCGVCAINFAIIALITGLVKRNSENKNYVSIKITSTLVCFFSLVFIATSISKMILYIKDFGLTRLRVETSVFMVILGLLFIGTLVYIFKNKFPIAKYIVICTTIVTMIMAFADVDKTVARYNVYAYKNEILSDIDVEHLGTLSDSALPYIEQLLDDKSENVRTRAENELYNFALRYYIIPDMDNADTDSDWTSYNYSREKAKEIILKNKDLIKETDERFWMIPEDYEYD